MTFQLVTTVNDRDMITEIVQDMENLRDSDIIGEWSRRLDELGKRSGIFMDRLPDTGHIVRSGAYVLILWDGYGTAGLFVETMHSHL